MPERILLVGEDFGNSTAKHDDVHALTGSSGRRLAALAGLEFPLEYARTFERTNVVELAEHWKDKNRVLYGSMAAIRKMQGRKVILLGNRVARALAVENLSLLEWSSFWGDAEAVVARFPHPSGRSHWWNDPENESKAALFLTVAVIAARAE